MPKILIIESQIRQNLIGKLQMHVELIGSTSAGKTTLAKKMTMAGLENGTEVILSDDFMLKWTHLNWVKNEFIRRRIVEMVALTFSLMYFYDYKDFIGFLIHEGWHTPGSGFYKVNRIRNVIRKIGIYEFIARNSGEQQIVLADNEGILQGVHNLFVHQGHAAILEKVTKYVERIPLPDVILYLRQNEETLISRTLERGHGRVRSSHDEVAHFIKQAVSVFEETVRLPKIKERLLIVNSDLQVQFSNEDYRNNNLSKLINLIPSSTVVVSLD